MVMPEFRVEWRDRLNRHLSDQGVKDVFDPMAADLQFMLPNADDAFVKQVESFLFWIFSIKVFRCFMLQTFASVSLESRLLVQPVLR